MKITFTIYGNHEDQHGNPVPYVRSTRDALWRKDGKRYAHWKDYVVKAFMPLDQEPWFGTFLRCGKPIDLKRSKANMNIGIFWRNGAHGDPDNIWKGICDALFVNDRNVDGSFTSSVSPDGRVRVEVIIEIHE